MKTEVTHYVLGFAFTEDGNKVILIEKQKPEWQKGLYNGVGGKIEGDDASGPDAMQREFKEETGLDIKADDWHYVGNMVGKDWTVSVYSVFTDRVAECKTCTDEKIKLVRIDFANNNFLPCIDNIPALLYLCRIKEPFSHFRLFYQ